MSGCIVLCLVYGLYAGIGPAESDLVHVTKAGMSFGNAVLYEIFYQVGRKMKLVQPVEHHIGVCG